MLTLINTNKFPVSSNQRVTKMLALVNFVILCFMAKLYPNQLIRAQKAFSYDNSLRSLIHVELTLYLQPLRWET